MGIGSITSINSMSVTQMTASDLKDQKSKSIQSEITNVQQQMQKLSSKEDLTVNEKTKEQKKLKKEISSLNTELKQHQEELRRSQKREIMMAQLQEDTEPEKEKKAENKTQQTEASSDTQDKKNLPGDEQRAANQGTVITQNSDGTVILKEAVNQSKSSDTDTENKHTDETKENGINRIEAETTDNDMAADTNLSVREMHAMVSADSSVKQAGHLGTIVAKTRDGIAILKGEINRDEGRGIDTERKKAELEKMQKQEQQAMTFQFSILGDANDTIKSAAETNASLKDNIQTKTENTFYVSGLNTPQEEQTAQQQFYVSFGS